MPLQIPVGVNGLERSGVGLIAIVKLLELPAHPFAAELTVITELIGMAEELVAINEAISPIPKAGKPIAVFVLVHEKTVPGTDPVKLIGAIIEPLHTFWLADGETSGAGLTVIIVVTIPHDVV